ncbi:MAG: cell division protein ZipA [Gammaproteobacteria bacterium]|nr:cell division protein ZipA [Gammaproteobacteria bacterium]|tara:strand:+ start:1194 stop:1808 length:615 start_codon:yes stop_codon:yes gene_type:complete
MGSNSEIYLIGLAVLFFLIIVFLFVRKITNSNKLKVKIETNPDPFDSVEKNNDTLEEKSIDLYESKENQELACFYLLSVDKTIFDIDQIFGFLSNYGAKIKNKYFSLVDKTGIEKFRIINALKPGTFENDTKTFAIVVVSDLIKVSDPVITVKQMIEFSINFSEKFHATLCDDERTPISKQMISHMESRAQDIERINQLNKTEN